MSDIPASPEPAATPPVRRWPRVSRRAAHAVAAGILALSAALMAVDIARDSPTYDEPFHTTRGLALWWEGDSRLSFAHPPLANALQAAPGAARGAAADLSELRGWEQSDLVEVARGYGAKSYDRARSDMVLGRAVTAALALLLGVYLYARALRHGAARALLVLGLYALHPMVLAHGHLTTTDLPIAVTFVIAVCEWQSYLTGGRPLRLATAALALGAAMVTKFSALILPPAFALVALYAALRRAGRFSGLSWPRVAGGLARDAAVVLAVVLLVINASYGFQRTGWTVDRILAEPEPAHWLSSKQKGNLLDRSALAALPGGLRVPLPYTYVFGTFSAAAHTRSNHGNYFFGGLHGPSPAYFPVLLVLKSPVGFLFLLGVGASLLRVRRRWPRLRTVALATAPALFMALAVRSQINLGVRHVLPVVPFLAMVAARGGAWLALRPRRAATRVPVRIARFAAAGAAGLVAVEAVAATPHHLSHFNWLVGARAGHWVSMVGEDWGQDIASLGEALRERDASPVYYEPYGDWASAELSRAGVRHRRLRCNQALPRPAWVAIHASVDVRRRKPCAALRDGAVREAVIDHHILVYRLEDAPASPPAKAPDDAADGDDVKE
ncbi:glycosyltransferase family 39 protein [Sorangium sp. So ce406]|uniref:glycosyltransferase family 39 protein n=1 Tax=Sorangium sp. So ce406 TaxID=3133311 RepID=UPI003F5B98BE